MAMDSQHYVAPNGQGGFIVVWNGQVIGNNYPTQQLAEQAYIKLDQPSVVAPPASSGGYTGGSGTAQFPGTLEALARSNQMNLDWDKEQFMKQFGLDERKFEELKRQFDSGQYGQMALALLQGATALKGPQDPLGYAAYTNQGRDIFSTMFGNQATPAFGAPTGYSQAANITSVLNDLGIRNPYGNSAGGGTIGGEDTASLDWIWASRPDLKAFYEANGWQTGTPEQQRAVVRNWISQGDPAWKGMTSQQVAQSLGYKPAITPTPMPVETDGSTVDRRFVGPPETEDGVGYVGPPVQEGGIPNNIDPGVWNALGSTAQQLFRDKGYLVPNPHQINPAVWDSLNDSGKMAIINAAERGYSQSGAWNANDFLRQLNASRPQGVAPRQVSYNWGRSQPLF